MMKRLATLTLLSSLFLAACGSPPTPSVEAVATPPEVESPMPLATLTPTSPPSTPTPAKPPTPTSLPPTPTPAGPPPAPGTGNVTGRILWDGEPVADLEIKLCEEVSLVRGCSGLEFNTTTDETGTYLLADCVPGEYGLVAHALEADRWLYVTSGLGLGARKYSLAADQTLYVGDQHIFKSDLSLTAPDDEGQVDSATPTLAWEPYADAAYYEVYLAPENGGPLFVNQRVDDSQIALDLSLVAPESLSLVAPESPFRRGSRPGIGIPGLRYGFQGCALDSRSTLNGFQAYAMDSKAALWILGLR